MAQHKLFAVLVTLHLLADLFVALLTDRRLSDARLGIVWSIFFAQVILAGVWLALGSGKFVVRVALSMSLVSIASAAQVIALVRDDAPRHFIPVTISAAVIQYSIVAGLLLPIRIAGGWQFGHEQSRNKPQRSDLQFGLAQLLILTACAAIALGVMRNAFRNIDLEQTGISAGVYGLLIVSNVFIGLPTMRAAMAEQFMLFWLLACLVFSIGVTLVEVTVFERAIAPPRSPDTFFWCLNTLEFCWIAFSLLVLRVDGFRLLRVKPGESEPL